MSFKHGAEGLLAAIGLCAGCVVDGGGGDGGVRGHEPAPVHEQDTAVVAGAQRTIRPAPAAVGAAIRPTEVDAVIADSLARLAALHVVDVGRLVLNLPAEATACYGLPCPDSGWQKAYDEERARQADRLGKLAAVAEQTHATKGFAPHPSSEAEAAAAALAGLQIVEVEGLILDKPSAPSPSCYNLPCDWWQVEETNAARVAEVFAIVAAAKNQGL